MKCPNNYSGILRVCTNILKKNVYLDSNLPEIFCKSILLIFLPGLLSNKYFLHKILCNSNNRFQNMPILKIMKNNSTAVPPSKLQVNKLKESVFF